MRFHKLPPGLPLYHPISFLSTWFGSGLIGFASGTWGSLAAIPFAVAISHYFGNIALAIAALLIFAVGVWTSGIFSRRLGVADPSAIVIDEVAGQWMTCAFLPLDPLWYGAAFFAFRAADIVKPFPANWCDRHLHGGMGVMLDDLISGVYTGIALWLLHSWISG